MDVFSMTSGPRLYNEEPEVTDSYAGNKQKSYKIMITKMFATLV
jgi:hypothetical protein